MISGIEMELVFDVFFLKLPVERGCTNLKTVFVFPSAIEIDG